MTEVQSGTALVGGTLLDVRTGEVTPNSCVRISGDHIVQVGTAGEIEIPPDTRVIDTTDRWIIPGLTDMHVHLTTDPLHNALLPLYLLNGVTTVRDVGGNLTVLSLLRDAIESGATLGPRMFMAGPILDGIPPLWPPASFLVDTPERAESAVRFLADEAVDLVKVYNNVPLASLEAIVRTGHELDLPVTGHVPRSITTTQAIESGMDGLEHIRITGRELLPPEEAARIDYLPLTTRETMLWERFELDMPGMERLVALMAESGVYLDPTLLIDQATATGSIAEGGDHPANRHLPPPVIAELTRKGHLPLYQVPEELKERARRGFSKRLIFIGMCNRAGVRLLAGTDTLGPGNFLPGFSLHGELALLVEAGLTPLQALQAATSTAAASLDREDLGAIEPGSLADLVILSADPLQDIANIRSVHLVFKGGTMFEPDQLLGTLETTLETLQAPQSPP